MAAPKKTRKALGVGVVVAGITSTLLCLLFVLSHAPIEGIQFVGWCKAVADNDAQLHQEYVGVFFSEGICSFGTLNATTDWDGASFSLKQPGIRLVGGIVSLPIWAEGLSKWNVFGIEMDTVCYGADGWYVGSAASRYPLEAESWESSRFRCNFGLLFFVQGLIWLYLFWRGRELLGFWLTQR